MSEYPPQVELFHQAIERLRGVVAVETGLRELAQLPPETYSLPGEPGDLPHALLRRTGGGLPDEAWANTEIRLARNEEGWLALEFLAWWVRDQSRGGDQIQMRPLALPPRGFEKQLGTTLKLIIDHFELCPEDPSPMLTALEGRARSLDQSISLYSEELGSAAT